MNQNSKADESSVAEILDSEIRFQIFSLLNMYPELSFTELSEKLNKSKSTLHPHLKKLIEDLGILEISKKVRRGGNPAQYYSLKPGYEDKTKRLDTDLSQGIDKQLSEILIRRSRNWLVSIIKPIETAVKFLNQLELSEEAPKILEDMFITNKNKSLSSVAFLSEDSLKEVRVLFDEFIEKVDQIEIEERKKNQKIEKPYYFYSGVLPFKMIIENLNRLPKKAR